MKSGLLSVTALATTLAVATQLPAQTPAATAPSGTTSPVQGVDGAQAPSPDAVPAGEIVVTAQKRTERLRDVPAAVSVVSSATLARANVSDISDINKLVPSVELKGTTNGRVPLAIRGISTNANEGTVGLTQGVAIQLDGVPIPSDFFNGDKLEDVAQVEVLKGPQATLGGRTASAGVINIVTQGPSNVWTGSVSGLATTDSELQAKMYLAGPLAEGLTFSLTGYGDRVYIPVKNIQRDEQSRSVEYGTRGKLKFVSGDFDATVMGHYSEFHSRGENFTYQYLTPGANLFPYIPSAFNAAGVPTAFGIPQSQAFAGVNIRYGNTDYASPVHMFSNIRDYDGSLTLNYHLGDVTLSSLTAYQKEHQAYSQDVPGERVYFFNVLTGGFAPPFFNVQNFIEPIDQTTQEFKITTPVNRPLSLVAGAFYSSTNVHYTQNLPFVANPLDSTIVSRNRSYALYARATFKVTPTTSVIGGVR